MRSMWRIVAFILVFLVLIVPLAVYAGDGGPCPDDLEKAKDCDNEPPPYYVVINRSVEYKDRPGTGCQPIILKHPDCEDCTSSECTAIDVETEVCKPLLKDKVPSGETYVLYEMCCACASDPDGEWMFRVRKLDSDGNCPIDPDNPKWITDLPPGTGIDLPAPVIVGGLVAVGLVLLALGVGLRRRTARTV
jgi:hypothetical protein